MLTCLYPHLYNHSSNRPETWYSSLSRPGEHIRSGSKVWWGRFRILIFLKLLGTVATYVDLSISTSPQPLGHTPPYMSIHNSTTKHPITLTLGILAYLDPMSISGLVAESDEVVFEPLFFHRRGSFSHTPPYMSICNSTTKHPITLRPFILPWPHEPVWSGS